jgi:predicted nucleic acid-binding protein
MPTTTDPRITTADNLLTAVRALPSSIDDVPLLALAVLLTSHGWWSEDQGRFQAVLIEALRTADRTDEIEALLRVHYAYLAWDDAQ